LGLPVTLRPYSGELLYSWLSRVAALYRVGMIDLLGPTVPAQELCLEPSVSTLETLAAVMRLSAPEIRALCVCSDQISQAWWNIRQITPDAFSPEMEYQFRPAIKFCRVCLWHDFTYEGNEFLRRQWMLCVPTICSIHGMPLEERCRTCLTLQLPSFVKTGRGFRVTCSNCGTFLAGSEISLGGAKIAEASQIKLLQRFEAVVYDALNNRWNVGFPGASVGPRELLRTVEDLLWLITRTVEGFDQMFVHHLNDTSFRVPRFIYQLPKAHPWLGQFPISTRLGLVSHLAALFGGAAIRQQLFTDPTVPYALLAGLKSLVPSDAKQFNQKMASWPDEHKSLVFGPNYTH
jgi:hypothetical protein